MAAGLESDPCAVEALALLGPAGSVGLRTASKRLNRAWWGHLRRWIEHQLGDRGWLATDHWRWWKAAARHGYAAAFRKREHFLELHAVFAAAVRNAFTLHLDPHLAAAAPLLAAPGPRGGVDTVERLNPRQSAPLLEQYRQRLGRLRWRKLWEKAWETLCWMPAVWAAVSYRSGDLRLLDERVAALESRRPASSYHHYNLETAWDHLCLRVLPMEARFVADSMPRAPPAFPPAPQLPNLRPERQRFLEGSRAFLRGGGDDDPGPPLLRLYSLVAHRLPRYRARLDLAHYLSLHLERGSRVDCLMLVCREEPVATVAVRHRGYLRRGPRVLRARLLVAQPRLLPRFERIGLRYLYRCGRSRGECVWCGRLDPSGMCEDASACRRLHIAQ